MDRVSALGIEKLYLPHLSNTKPDEEPHIPILAPPADILKTRKRVIVLINDTLQDLGILAYRQLQREFGLNGGSVVNFVKEIINRSTEGEDGSDLSKDGAVVEDKTKDTPGLIVMNCGQLLYSHKTNETLSMRSWIAKTRKSICHDVIEVHEKENHIEGHRDPQEHMKTAFDTVIHNPDFVAADAEVYVIAIQNGADHLLDLLGSGRKFHHSIGDVVSTILIRATVDKYAARITAMAIVDTMVDATSIHNPSFKAFLHQRVRQWKITDNTDPRKCSELPSDYASQDGAFDYEKTKGQGDAYPKINWLDTVSPSSLISTVTGLLKRLKMTVTPHKSTHETEAESTDFYNYGYDPICPTFGSGDGDESVGECIFTTPTIQQAILEFFEEVAQNPSEYHNPAFTTSNAPQPTPDSPLELDPEDSGITTFQPLPAEMSPEQQEVDIIKRRLANMKACLAATPEDNPELEEGRAGLEKRIVTVTEELEEAQKKALASGGLGAGEAEEIRENWEPQYDGPKVPFAGTMVDSELLKGAGLFETAEKALEELDSAHKD
jgi:hypothetical protein